MNATEHKRIRQRRNAWERMCDPTKGCGTICCYYGGSPCEHLVFTDEAKALGRCSIYEHRFGIHQTVDGQAFQCVNMADWLLHNAAPRHCGYAVVRSVNGVPVVRGLP